MAVDVEDLRRRMATLPDELLLEIVVQERRQYRQVALEIAEAELLRRGLAAAAASRAAQFASQKAVAHSFRRPARTGQDVITNGCLGIVGFVVFVSATISFEGFTRWFWPGVLGWFLIPLLLASLFGLAHWTLTALRRKP